MLIVKQIKEISEKNRVYYLSPEDNANYVYFNILSSHYLKNYTFRMTTKAFDCHFHRETLEDINVRDVFISRNWLFPMKVDWWNFNINAVESCATVLDINSANMYNTLIDEYCTKFNCSIRDFHIEYSFFDDLLTHYKVNAGGKLTPYKNQKRRK